MSKKEQLEALESAKNTVIRSIAETMDLYGVTPSIGRLYGTMYFRRESMTLDEMKDELGMSKPSMSTAVRALQEIDMMKKTWSKGSRKDQFVSEKDFFKFFFQFFCKMWEREVKINLDAINQTRTEIKELLKQNDLDEEVREEAEHSLKLITDSTHYYYWLEDLVKSFHSGDIFDLVPIPEKETESE
ncbi:choline uptake/conversion transcriptional regulator CudC [Pseudalkalibacillus decolorationis]|uniref:choline uptake/conversion transcriptional regulator CudC n=1 Tax=Pseudalkalibacillus decolorationis TaxID=163879 RepID=UPI002147F5AE|nr:GbsR/MarR family transcriptional regulator [Pseudalkalibacillus decolorationis]